LETFQKIIGWVTTDLFPGHRETVVNNVPKYHKSDIECTAVSHAHTLDKWRLVRRHPKMCARVASSGCYRLSPHISNRSIITQLWIQWNICKSLQLVQRICSFLHSYVIASQNLVLEMGELSSKTRDVTIPVKT